MGRMDGTTAANAQHRAIFLNLMRSHFKVTIGETGEYVVLRRTEME